MFAMATRSYPLRRSNPHGITDEKSPPSGNQRRNSVSVAGTNYPGFLLHLEVANRFWRAPRHSGELWMIFQTE
jgi:hypothetical protein